MIPYDDLVVALATWRARQGLPVSSLSGALSPPMVVAPPARAVAPAAPPRPAAPPPPAAPVAAAPKPSSGPVAMAPPLAPPPLAPPQEDSLDGELLEEPESVYDNEGDDFALAFAAGAAAAGSDPEETAIGSAPRPSGDFGSSTDPHHDVATHKSSGQHDDATGEHTIAGGDPDRTDW